MQEIDRLGILGVGLFSAAAIFIGTHDLVTGVAVGGLGASLGFLAWGDRLLRVADVSLIAIPICMAIVGFMTFRVLDQRFPALALWFAGIVGSVTVYTTIRIWFHGRPLRRGS